MTQTSRIVRKDDIARVPRNFAFPVNPTGPVRLSVSTPAGDEYELLVGGVAPLSGADNSTKDGLTLAHARVIFRVLYGIKFDTPDIPVTFADLLRKGSPQSGRAFANVRKLVNELASSWVHVVRPDQRTRTVRLMDFEGDIEYRNGVIATDTRAISQEKNVKVRRLTKVRFAEDFWRACLTFQDCWAVRVDALDSMSSDLAAFCYLKLAPNTHTKERPVGHRFRKDAGALLTEAGINVAEPRRVKEYFERVRGGAMSVLGQMNQQAMWVGRFRVEQELERAATGIGYNVVYWREDTDLKTSETELKSAGALHEIWTREMGTPKGYFEAASLEQGRLEPHNIEILEMVGYRWEPHVKFLERVKSFIGRVRFDTVLSSVKLSAQTGPSISNIGGYIGAALTSEFEQWVKQRAKVARR